MKYFVQAGPSRTLKCSNEKFIVDFAQGMGVIRQSRHTHQSKSFYESLRSQLVMQHHDVQRGLGKIFTPHSTMAISWLAEFIHSLEPGYLALRRVQGRVLQLEQASILTEDSTFDGYPQQERLSVQLATKMEQIENHLLSVNLVERARTHCEHVLAGWRAGNYSPFSPVGRCYVALQELYWGAFGEAMLFCNDPQKTELIEAVRVQVVDQLANEVNASSHTRHYYHQWLTTPPSQGVMEYKEALAWLGDTSDIDKQPVSYSVTQTWRGISLGMPRICSAMRLGGALVDELFI